MATKSWGRDFLRPISNKPCLGLGADVVDATFKFTPNGVTNRN